MKRISMFLALSGCWLVLMLLVPAWPLRADDTTAAADSRSILTRLPISFRQVDGETRSSTTDTAEQQPAGLPLAPRGKSAAHHASSSPPTAGRAIATVVSSLAVVVGLLGVVAWLARRFHPTPQSLPSELYQHLGTTTLGGRQSIHVMRFGAKLLLVVAGPTGLQPLAELTDADDVERLTALCRPKSSSTIAATLQRVVADWSNSSPPRAGARSVRPATASLAAAPRAGGTSHA